MSYIDVITLAEAKVYLRVDNDLTEDDNQITRMINSALKYVEDVTNIMMFARNKSYRLIDGCVRIYDAPINSEVTADLVVENKTLYTNYKLGSDNGLIVLNVGYVTATDIPQELISVAFELIDIFYYGKESGKGIADLSPLAMDILNRNKRFIL